jgi:hypothetical protein
MAILVQETANFSSSCGGNTSGWALQHSKNLLHRLQRIGYQKLHNIDYWGLPHYHLHMDSLSVRLPQEVLKASADVIL